MKLQDGDDNDMDASPNPQDLTSNSCLKLGYIFLAFKLRKNPISCIFELYMKTCSH